jgi:DtxR family Mn-dependent transcriptional regulator
MATLKKTSANDRPLTPIMEDYIEAIFDLNREKAVIRVRDIAKKLHVKMPTVSSMLKVLNDRGLVHYKKYEYIQITRDGIAVGREIRRRHDILLKFLTEVLHIDHPVADREACKLEHAIGAETLGRLKELTAFIRACADTSGPREA